MTRPAAPLEKAVEEHRAALNSERNCRVGCVHLDEVLRTGDALLAALDADKRLEEAERLIREVSEGGVEFEDERVRYVAIQIDSETWAEIRRYFAEKGER